MKKKTIFLYPTHEKRSYFFFIKKNDFVFVFNCQIQIRLRFHAFFFADYFVFQTKKKNNRYIKPNQPHKQYTVQTFEKANLSKKKELTQKKDKNKNKRQKQKTKNKTEC